MEFSIDMGTIIRESKNDLNSCKGIDPDQIEERFQHLHKRLIDMPVSEIGTSDLLSEYTELNRQRLGLTYDPKELFQVVMSEVFEKAVFAMRDCVRVADGRLTATVTLDVSGPVIDGYVALHKRNKENCIMLPMPWEVNTTGE